MSGSIEAVLRQLSTLRNLAKQSELLFRDKFLLGDFIVAVDIFAFGTLKKGYPLHETGLHGAKFLGNYCTVERFPLVIAGRWFAPMMFNEPGTGYNVVGELYRIDPSALCELDDLESIGSPGNFRVRIEAVPLMPGPVVIAFAYMKSRELANPYHTGLLENYADDRFIPPSARQLQSSS
jgi:gamma-glutamylaminecyclotransferase